MFGGYAFWKDHSTHAWWGPSLRHLNWKLVQGTSAGPDAKNPLPPGSKDISPPGDKFNDKFNNSTNDYLLFDLDHDPGEENDLSTAYPEILQKMIYRLKLYRKYFVYPQVNDDSNCPFPGLVNTTTVGPAWCGSKFNIMRFKIQYRSFTHCCTFRICVFSSAFFQDTLVRQHQGNQIHRAVVVDCRNG